MGHVVFNPTWTYARLAWPPALVEQARKKVFDSPKPPYLYSNSSIEKTWVAWEKLSTHMNSRFGTKPMVHLLYFTNNFTIVEKIHLIFSLFSLHHDTFTFLTWQLNTIRIVRSRAHFPFNMHGHCHRLHLTLVKWGHVLVITCVEWEVCSRAHIS
jgi:hypothetical protein